MMPLPLYELSFWGVVDHGKPNLERIVFRAAADINLSNFGIFLGWQVKENTVFPLRDLLFWFGDVTIQAGDWVMVFTGDGEYRKSQTQDDVLIHSFHWKSRITLFTIDYVVPVLFETGRTQICRPQPKIAFPGKTLAIEQG